MPAAQTIADNLALGNYRRVPPSGWISAARTQDFAARGIARFLVMGTGSQLVSELWGGNQGLRPWTPRGKEVKT